MFHHFFVLFAIAGSESMKAMPYLVDLRAIKAYADSKGVAIVCHNYLIFVRLSTLIV